MGEFVVIGKVLKPRGLSGEVKVQILTNKVEVFDGLRECELGQVDRSSVQNGFAYLVFSGVDSLEKAERLRGREIRVLREELCLGEDEVLESDLLGFVVEDTNGVRIGVVKSIGNYGGGDVFECFGQRGQFSFPNEDAFIVEINMAERKIVVRGEMLEEEIVF